MAAEPLLETLRGSLSHGPPAERLAALRLAARLIHPVSVRPLRTTRGLEDIMSTPGLEPKLLLPGEGTTRTILGERYTWKVSGADSGEAYALIEGEVPPQGGPPRHVHAREDEVFTCWRARTNSGWASGSSASAPAPVSLDPEAFPTRTRTSARPPVATSSSLPRQALRSSWRS
jgi:hypothetical protein